MAQGRSERLARWNDEELVAGFLKGEAGCFDVLHDRHRGAVFRFALRRLRDPCDAEDVTQEVFLQVSRCLGSFQWRCGLLGWILGIARNQVCKALRCRRPAGVPLDKLAAGLSAPQASVDRQVDAQRVLAHCQSSVLHELSPGQREIFRLKYFELRPTRVIARELGKSSQAVKISLFRSKRKLAAITPGLEPVLSA